MPDGGRACLGCARTTSGSALFACRREPLSCEKLVSSRMQLFLDDGSAASCSRTARPKTKSAFPLLWS